MITKRRRSVRRLPATFYEFASEAALIAFTLATVFTFQRLFLDSSYFVPVAAAAIAAHVVAAGVRWARGGILVSLIVSVLGLVATAAVLFPPTTVESNSLFNQAILSGFGEDLRLAVEQFQSVGAPTEVTAPFLLLVAIVMWWLPSLLTGPPFASGLRSKHSSPGWPSLFLARFSLGIKPAC